MDQKVMYALSYGLFVLSARRGEKDNGCITNTAIQVTAEPNRIAIAVNKANYTHDMVLETGKFTVSVLSEEAKFELFQRFGFQSGRDVDKLADFQEHIARDGNGVVYVTQGTNAWISCQVVSTMDLGTHTLFVADVTEARVLNNEPSITYAYYFDNTKPKPQPADPEQKGWVCKICGYVYEGEDIPADFICPLCKHGVADFEKIG